MLRIFTRIRIYLIILTEPLMLFYIILIQVRVFIILKQFANYFILNGKLVCIVLILIWVEFVKVEDFDVLNDDNYCFLK